MDENIKATKVNMPTGANREELSYKVHHVLAHSYTFFLSFLVIGIMLDIIFKLKIFNSTLMIPIGFVILFLSTLLILWAQNTSNNLNRENMTHENFCKGPYCYTRIPTHLGLFMMAIGCGFILNATFVIIMSVFAFIFNKLVFLEEEEKILAKKYGNPYVEYKKRIRF